MDKEHKTNVELFSIHTPLEEPLRNIHIEKYANPRWDSNESLILTFDKGHTVQLTGKHDNDCCERVYADFSAVIDSAKQLITSNHYLYEIEVAGVPDMGILLRFNYSPYRCLDPSLMEKIFIPCRNEQNGYYSDQLSLTVATSSKAIYIEHDITPYKVDDID